MGQLSSAKRKGWWGTYHLSKSSRRDDISSMNEAVEVACILLDGFPHVVVYFHVEDVGHQIEGVLVVLHFGVETGQVETIRQVVLVDLAEIFIAP